MDTQSYKTVSLKAGDIKKEWVVIDATDLVVGLFAVMIGANMLVKKVLSKVGQ